MRLRAHRGADPGPADLARPGRRLTGSPRTPKVAVPGSCRRLKTWALDLRGRVLSQLGYGLRVKAGHPLVREVFPELAAELVALLEENGERELAMRA